MYHTKDKQIFNTFLYSVMENQSLKEQFDEWIMRKFVINP